MRITALAGCLALVLTACATTTAGGRPLRVFAASSLQDVLPVLATAYAEATPRVTLQLAFDGSSRLRSQIELGAPADLFLSADEASVATLAEAGRGHGDPVAFTGNLVVLVVPRDEATVGRWQDVAVPGTRIVAAGEDVPITRYAERMVRLLAQLPEAPPGFAEAYARNVVSREDNVRAALAKVALGEADAALVYATDVGPSVQTVPLPAVEVRAGYWGLALTASDRGADATAFLAWLTTPAAQSIFAAYGFTSPP